MELLIGLFLLFFGPDDIDGALYAAQLASGILLWGVVIFVVLYWFGEYDRRRLDRMGPVEKLIRDRHKHFGGV